MIVVFIGPPGSGKGTQAELLSASFRVISVGDVLRSIVESNSEGSEAIKGFINSGKLVPINIINQIMLECLNNFDSSENIILDGYPRNLEQALFLKDKLTANLKVLFFDIDDNLLLERIKGRFICSSCKKVYNSHYHLPQLLGVCDNCGSTEFDNRADDQIDIIKERIKLYRLETAPLVDFYNKNHQVSFINANQSIDKVFCEVKKVLRSY